MTTLPLYQIDAFTDRLFAGNPAAVVICDDVWPSDDIMQAIAAENNLAETAFLHRTSKENQLRFFTPTFEIDLCGHATLCTAHVVFHHLQYPEPTITFMTPLAGEITITRDNNQYVMNLPAWPLQPISNEEQARLLAALRLKNDDVIEMGKKRDYMVVLRTPQMVRDLAPDFAALKEIPTFACVTAATQDGNFVSRFFTPIDGIDEDPVTGSSHCMLVPYWAAKLGKRHFIAHQLSARGGVLTCVDLGDRVTVAGSAVTFLEGKITL